MNKTIRITIGIVISAVCLWVAFKGFQFSDLKLALSHANYSWFFIFAIFFYCNHLIRTLRWRIFLSPIKIIPVFSLYPVLLFGFFMNTVLPARAGEFIRAYTVHKHFDISTVSSFGSVIAERLSDFFGLFLIVLISTRVLPIEKLPIFQISSVLLVGLIALSAALYFAQRYKTSTENMVGIKKKAFEFFFNALKGFVALKSKRKIFLICFLSAAIWINEVLMVLFISKAMGLNLPFLHSCAVIIGISLGVMIPAAPGFIGTFEFFAKEMLLFLGYDPVQSLNSVLVLHFLQVVGMSIAGIISSIVLKKSAQEKGPLLINPAHEFK